MNLNTQIYYHLRPKYEVQHVPAVTSTNDWAKEPALSANEKPQIYLTDHQTKGRGRGTHTWLSQPGSENLLMTLALPLTHAPQPIITPRVGLVLCEQARRAWPELEWSIKPPNDLYLQNKKVAGVLVEALNQGSLHRLIIGIGFNFFSFPAEIENSTALFPLAQTTNTNFAAKSIEFVEDLLHSLIIAAQLDLNLLSDVECKALAALINKQLFANLREVKADGSLIFTDKKISWESL